MYNTPEPTKEPFSFETALPEARTDQAPRRPTRAYANRQRHGNRPVKGSNTAKPPRLCKATRQPPTDGHNPRAHQPTASRTLTAPRQGARRQDPAAPSPAW